MKSKDSLKDIVYNKIIEGIFTDEYRPNQIINEKELIEKFGYSKSPIREALLTLCNEGVLRNFPRYGYEVVRLSREVVDQILDYRLLLEGGTLKKCFESITEDKIADLWEADKLCHENSNDVWTHWEANTQFHLHLLSFGNNEYSIQQLQRSMTILKRAYAQFYWQTWSQVEPAADTRYHAEIISNIRKKNIEKALWYLQEDLKDFC